jgi:hypothetical protein
MNALGFVALVVAVFFVIGIGVGVTAVIALSVTRRNRAQLARRARWRETERRGPQGADDEIGYDEDDYDDTRPQWPDTGYQA